MTLADQNIEIYGLAFTSYVYKGITGYDETYKKLIGNTKGIVDLNNPQHREFIIKWLNSWGCRQFAVKYHSTASESILKWYTENSEKIIDPAKSLLDINELEIRNLGEAFETLSNVIASYRDNRIIVKIGPTGAAKLLFALRPNSLLPWDEPIRKHFEYDGKRESYEKFLIHIKTQLLYLEKECRKHGFSIEDLPTKLSRPDVTLPKLIDEYYWVVITKKVLPPEKDTIKEWSNFCN